MNKSILTAKENQVKTECSITDTVWEMGIQHEIDYWRNKLSTTKAVDMRTKELSPEIACYLPPDWHQLKVLDVGCGPLITIGGVCRGKKLDIVGIDPLNDAYQKLFDELGLERPFPAITGLGEELEEYFEKQTFDLVFSQNALDHAQNPYKAIQAMLAVCKEGGLVIFSVFENEAINAGYSGFHQWNFSKIDNTIVFWNDENAFVLDECIKYLPYIAKVSDAKRNRKYPRKITCVIRKTARNKDLFTCINTGTYLLYECMLNMLVLLKDDTFSNQQNFFLHVERQGKVIFKTSFPWNIKHLMKSVPLPDVHFDAIVLGQFESHLEEGKKVYTRTWSHRVEPLIREGKMQ